MEEARGSNPLGSTYMEGKSTHILNASSNLLGFSFLVLSSIHGFGLADAGRVDEISAICVVSFALASFFSFISIRSKSERRSVVFEAVADYVFFAGLSVLVVTSILLASGFIALAG